MLALASPACAGFDQPTDGARYPTAGLLEHRGFRVQARVAGGSSVLAGARLGVKDVVQIGVFYGAQHLLDDKDVTTNAHAGFETRVRLHAESSWPALAVGFSSQGWGEYDPGLERYARKSPGFYGVLSRNWHSFLGDLSLHAGINYSLETRDRDAPNAFAAADWTIAGRVSILCDVDAAWNDDRRDGRYGEGGPYLDAGLRAGLGKNLSLMLVFADLTGTRVGGEDPARELEVVFMDWF